MTDANEQIISKAQRNDLTGVVSRFTSKGKIGVGGQGMFNCITFPKVDDVPRILQRSVKTADVLKAARNNPRRNLKCAITNKVRTRQGEKRRARNANDQDEKRTRSYIRSRCASCVTTATILVPHPNPFSRFAVAHSQDAKYYDPLTKMGYCDLEGFKQIRTNYAKGNMAVGTTARGGRR